MQKYVLIQWPDSQALMDMPWFKECVFCMDLEGHEEVGDSAYMIPEERYEEFMKETKK
jgi:hypothetical protein